MALRFEELDWQQTPIGEISLRRRVEPSLGVDVYEVKLGDEYLMSSLFTVAEVALARLGLAEVEGGQLDVLVGQGARHGVVAAGAVRTEVRGDVHRARLHLVRGAHDLAHRVPVPHHEPAAQRLVEAG